jgi:hypothetical protein
VGRIATRQPPNWLRFAAEESRIPWLSPLLAPPVFPSDFHRCRPVGSAPWPTGSSISS